LDNGRQENWLKINNQYPKRPLLNIQVLKSGLLGINKSLKWFFSY